MATPAPAAVVRSCRRVIPIPAQFAESVAVPRKHAVNSTQTHPYAPGRRVARSADPVGLAEELQAVAGLLVDLVADHVAAVPPAGEEVGAVDDGAAEGPAEAGHRLHE